jgi:NAD(P)-dependent dehydrogenase (short-subunit alcohol dehydrogenase family)
MNGKKVWFVTGAGRGLGVDIAKAALAAGHAVVATGRNPEKLSGAIGEHVDLLAVKLDVTDPTDAEAAVAAAIDRFGRIDVLVNNAGNFNAGFFEELSPEEFRAQIETTFFGPVNVTRAALPVMRAQRSGLVVTISSTAGLEGGEFTSAYAASKFGVEGWMESLAPEVAPFGIHTMLVEPGFFRTELLTPESTKYAASSIEDYAERTEQTVTAWKGMNGQQGGDPAKLADALVRPWQVRRSRRYASPPAPTRSPRSREGPRPFSARPTPTATCPAASPSIRTKLTPLSPLTGRAANRAA